ncbi:UDP-glucose 4-epimerase GalE [Jatrophihabitans sp. YIM 134969]
MRLLIVGGAGYIGSVVGAQCLAAGHEVVVLDDLSTGHADSVAPGARLVQAPVTEAAQVLAELGRDDGPPVDAVLHFAAKSLVGESTEHPDRYFHTNVEGTLALLDAMRLHAVPTIVFSSTAATYGEPELVPIPETAPTAPTNPYGASKLAVDLALGSYAPAFGLAAVSLRYFNVAGALQQDGRWFGERHTTETHLIPIALQVATGAREDLAVYGRDYPTPDGTCVRDYIHVVDLGRAHLAALDAAVAGRHQVVNLGSGSGNSVLEVVETVRAVTGHALPTVDHDRRAGDPAVLVASNARAADVLGWHPERDLQAMVADAWAFTQATA